jgi:hypothetical protein
MPTGSVALDAHVRMSKAAAMAPNPPFYDGRTHDIQKRDRPGSQLPNRPALAKSQNPSILDG